MNSITIRAEGLPAVLNLSRSAVIKLRKDDPTFPRPRLIGGRHKAWLRSELEAWAAGLPTPNEED